MTSTGLSYNILSTSNANTYFFFNYTVWQGEFYMKYDSIVDLRNLRRLHLKVIHSFYSIILDLYAGNGNISLWLVEHHRVEPSAIE